MSKQKRLSSDEIKAKIKGMSDFVLNTDSERKRALMIAKGMGADIYTREIKGGKFQVLVLSEVEN